MKNLIIIAVVLSTICSCTKDPMNKPFKLKTPDTAQINPPQPPKTKYYHIITLDYEDQPTGALTKELTVSASLRENAATGNTPALIEKPFIYIDGHNYLEYATTAKQTLLWDIDTLQDLTFRTITDDADTLLNKAKASDFLQIDFPVAMPETLSRAAGYVITWNGPALQAGETATISIKNSSKLLERTVNSGNSIELKAADLAGFTEDQIYIVLTRTRELKMSPSGRSMGGVCIFSSKCSRVVSLKP